MLTSRQIRLHFDPHHSLPHFHFLPAPTPGQHPYLAHHPCYPPHPDITQIYLPSFFDTTSCNLIWIFELFKWIQLVLFRRSVTRWRWNCITALCHATGLGQVVTSPEFKLVFGLLLLVTVSIEHIRVIVTDLLKHFWKITPLWH